MPTRELVETTEAFKRFLVRDDTGKEVGTDVETIPTSQQVNGATLRSRLLRALAANAAYLAKTTTTNAENTAHLRLVTQELSALIRLMLELLDTTEGT